MNPTFSEEGFALITKLARAAGMSPSAYVREAAARSAGWDEAMTQLRAVVDEMRKVAESNAREIAYLKREVAALRHQQPR